MGALRAAPRAAGGAAPARLRICLAASGGGHVRQLLDLERVWSRHDHFFLTEDTPLTRSIAQKSRVCFVPHFALGQARVAGTHRMLWAGLRNLFQSAGVMLRERPQIVISTGAGAVFFAVLWARLLGAKVVIVETFARFETPSRFARMAAPLAHRKVVQSAALLSHWPDAAVFDPFRTTATSRPKKQALVFVTVGAILTFDRLVRMVAELKARGEIPERVIVQTGIGGLYGPGLDSVEALPFDEMQRLLHEADIVICHGGTGSLITALRQGCRVIAVPRLAELGEVYDDHQAEITRSLAARGLIAVANTTEELSEVLKTVRTQPPVSATSDPTELIGHLEGLIAEWSGSETPGGIETDSN